MQPRYRVEHHEPAPVCGCTITVIAIVYSRYAATILMSGLQNNPGMWPGTIKMVEED